ncbi:gamma-carboxygeranoyl-CoA hydratase [Pseudomonas sp. NPDC007930]|uniref:gamma-carboxygeranoyl-CoA hydratase n=1 Tax=Pseudomonas sp. NPDC007930 TaxID=3364417 RepID=UPI0036EC83CC
MSDFSTLQLEKDPRGFATLWMDRSDKHNAFNAQMIAEMTAALALAEADGTLRFLLLRGRGKHFCAGADLAWMQASAQLDYAANLRDAQALAELLHRLHGLPIPTLAVVQGAAFGGAVGLASCCDMAIAASGAVFCLSEVRIGLVPGVISPFVVRALGERAARRYMLTAERFSAARAAELGLLSEVVAAEELEQTAERWAAQLLLNGPAALKACKALLSGAGAGNVPAPMRAFTEAAIARIRVSPEGQEGLAAFLEKRLPAWQEVQA